MKNVSIQRSLALLNTFHAMLAAARGAIFPFLTLYLRHLGLAAPFVGIVMTIRATVSSVSSSLWLRCTTLSIHHRKGMLCISLVVMIGSTMALLLVPAVNYSHADPCHLTVNQSLETPPTSVKPDMTTVTTPITKSAVTTSTTSVAKETTAPANHTAAEMLTSFTNDKLHNVRFTKKRLTNMAAREFSAARNDVLIKHTVAQVTKNAKKDGKSMKKKGILIHNPDKTHRATRHGTWTADTVVWRRLLALQQKSDIIWTLGVLALVLLSGTLLSAQPEMLARGVHVGWLAANALPAGPRRSWRLLGLMTTPVIAAALIPVIPCYVDSFSVHFSVFGVAAIIAFLISVFLPMPDDEILSPRLRATLTPRWGVLSDAHAVVLVVTAVLNGVIAAALDTFLLWYVQDVGGSRLQMAVVVAVAAASELAVAPLVAPLARLIGYTPLLTAGLVLTAARLALYSVANTALWCIPVTVLAGPAAALLRAAPHGHIDMRSGGSASAVLPAAYHSIGAIIGCITAGFTYDHFGFPIVLRAGSIAIVMWAVLAGILLRCGRSRERGIGHAKRHYAQLLADDGDQSDSSLNWEDDWLENAMKEDSRHPLKSAHP